MDEWDLHGFTWLIHGHLQTALHIQVNIQKAFDDGKFRLAFPLILLTIKGLYGTLHFFLQTYGNIWTHIIYIYWKPDAKISNIAIYVKGYIKSIQHEDFSDFTAIEWKTSGHPGLQSAPEKLCLGLAHIGVNGAEGKVSSLRLPSLASLAIGFEESQVF